MAISKETREFISNLIDYYINEAESYRQLAENFSEIESISDTTFGIIIGCVYSGFLQTYQNQQLSPGLEDIKEFNSIIEEHTRLIRGAINDPDYTSIDIKSDKDKLDTSSNNDNSGTTSNDSHNHTELDDIKSDKDKPDDIKPETTSSN